MRSRVKRAARDRKYAPVGIGNGPPDYRADDSASVADGEITDRVLRAIGDTRGTATTRELVEALGVAKADLERVLAWMRDAKLLRYEVTPSGIEWRRSGVGIERAGRRIK